MQRFFYRYLSSTLSAKSFGADCILNNLIQLVDKELAKDIYQTAKELDISTLVEVHSEERS